MREMKLNANMPSQGGEKIYQFSRKVSRMNSWQTISTSMSENFIIFLRALQMHFLHSTSETKEINNPLLCHQLRMAPDNPWLMVFKSHVISSPWVCGRSGDVPLSNGSITSMLRVWETASSILLALSLTHLLARSDAASWRGEMLYGETHVGRNWVRPAKNWILPITTWVS